MGIGRVPVYQVKTDFEGGRGSGGSRKSQLSLERDSDDSSFLSGFLLAVGRKEERSVYVEYGVAPDGAAETYISTDPPRDAVHVWRNQGVRNVAFPYVRTASMRQWERHELDGGRERGSWTRIEAADVSAQRGDSPGWSVRTDAPLPNFSLVTSACVLHRASAAPQLHSSNLPIDGRPSARSPDTPALQVRLPPHFWGERSYGFQTPR
ncbi:hypothetical protein EYF80_041472 [Liparis tanakae]|uniref:Uncharacterized protein n=1 Tax=Liparis tanakae TaxID=230148 RepID=A0A4Z2G5A4_9TELE|nr:hypothetical protein EYF80_041472 [Liparis tanakae]